MPELFKIQEIFYLKFFNTHLYELLFSAFLFLFIFYFRRGITGLIFRFFGFFASKTESTLDDQLLKKTKDPFSYLVVIAALYLSFSALSISDPSALNFLHIIATLFYIGISWILFVFVDTFAKEIGKSFEGSKKKVRSELVNFIIKFFKTVVVIFALIVILSEWEYDISAIIASLGLGGLAFALAAKDTVANLFGSMVILWDKPFEHGDWIESSGAEGTVIEIGLRSTTIRTFSNALITIPNAKLANESIVNWTKRKVGRRIRFELGVKYDSEPINIKNAALQIKEMLNNHDGISKNAAAKETDGIIKKNDLLGYKDTLIVNVDDFGKSGINILIYCFSTTVDWLEWLEVKEDVMFRIMEIFKNNNLEFAFPSQSIYIEKEAK